MGVLVKEGLDDLRICGSLLLYSVILGAADFNQVGAFGEFDSDAVVPQKFGIDVDA